MTKMMLHAMYRIQYARDVVSKDMPKLKSANLLRQFFKEIDSIKTNPYVGKILVGPLRGKRSVRINQQHRIFYTFDDKKIVVNGAEYEGTVYILQAFGHDLS